MVSLRHSCSFPYKLLILHGEAESYCFAAGCVPESMFDIYNDFHSDFLSVRYALNKIIIAKLSHAYKNEGQGD